MPRRSGCVLLPCVLDCRMPWRLWDPEHGPTLDNACPGISVVFQMGPSTNAHRRYSTRNLGKTQACRWTTRGALSCVDLDLARGLWYDGGDGSLFSERNEGEGK